METIIRVEGLRKVYKLGEEKVVALGCIDLEIHKGEICCILGTSGSGKSTLLNMLAGLEKPTRGHVYIGKHDVPKLSEKQLAKLRQRHIGFVFQSYNLLPQLTALENVAMPLMFRGVSKAQRMKDAKEILEQVGLGKRMYHRPTQMSGGQQQRAGIARAFVCRPEIVFADEPTGNLDSRTTLEVMEMMVKICRENNQTLILVTHDQSIASYADRIITLIDGAVVSDQPNQSVIDREDYIPVAVRFAEADAEKAAAEQQAAEADSSGKAAAGGKTSRKEKEKQKKSAKKSKSPPAVSSGDEVGALVPAQGGENAGTAENTEDGQQNAINTGKEEEVQL